MFFPLERRRFHRLIIPLPVRYQTLHPESGELHQGHGVVRDISLTGSYFHLNHQAPFEPGQVLSLTISAHLPFQEIEHISHFYAQAEVIRLEAPEPSEARYGVAVHFLQNLSFATA